MLTPNLLHDYQKKAVNHQCTRQESMLWLDMGLGKTVVTLTSISHLLSSGYLRGVIIVAPIRVIRLVWRQEAKKWEHTKDLKFSMVAGTKDQRTRALLRDADIYLINYENLKWLADTLSVYFAKKGRPLPFNGIVWDEISKMKNSQTNRVKAYMRIADQFQWSTGLTGTPASNGYKDLHGQFLVIDRGHRLGTSKTAFRSRFYRKAGPYKEVPYDDTESVIKGLIGDITLEMSAEDYNPLPDLVVNDIEIEMPEKIRADYERMEKEFFLKLDSGTEVEVFNQASLTNKCLQYSNGAIYPVPGMPLWEPIHDAKLDALEEILDEANGSPVLCSYAYRSDAERIMERFAKLDPINLTQCKSESSLVNAMHRWKTGQCSLMIGHPACLHPRTQVLTELRGWVRLIDVTRDDRVFDGIEFVSHDGCSYSGHKETVNLFGIVMTPDHKILVNGQWMEAGHVNNTFNTRQAALYQNQVVTDGIGRVSAMLDQVRDDQAECGEAQSGRETLLRVLREGSVSQHDGHPHLAHLAGHEVSGQGLNGSQLRWAWDRIVCRVGELRDVLRGHARRLLRRSDHRASRCEPAVPQGQLCMGGQHDSAGEQAQQQGSDISGGTDAPGRAGASERVQQDDAHYAFESWDEWGSGSGRRSKITLRQRAPRYKKTHVYDLVNCGPRHRFLIRNDDGEVFISHNSMGHGIDGLQSNGHILVWYGLNWSLDLYEQFNARVRRQGQGVPVICHRLLMSDTLDQAQAMALDEKATTQAGLRNAVKEYRKQKGE